MARNSKATAFPACNSWLNFRVRVQFEIKILIVRLTNTTYFQCIFKKSTWACDYLKTNLSADNFKQLTLDLDGSIPEPATRSGDTGWRIPCLDSWQLIKTWVCRLQAPRLARKCEIKHWFPCGEDGRSMVGRWTVTLLPNFLRWIDFLRYGTPLTRAWRARGAPLLYG